MWAVGCIYAELLTLRPIFKGEEAKIDNKKNLPFQKDQMSKIIEVLGSVDSGFSSPRASFAVPMRFVVSPFSISHTFSVAEERWPALNQYPETPHLSRMERCVFVLHLRPFLSVHPALFSRSHLFPVSPIFYHSHYPNLAAWYKSKSPSSSYSNSGFTLLAALFEFDPEKRITAREALGCAWFLDESPKPSLK